MTALDLIKEWHREQGYYSSGLPTGRTEIGDVVVTDGRAAPRIGVAAFPSDTSGIGVDNLYLTSLSTDFPTSAGTRAWVS